MTVVELFGKSRIIIIMFNKIRQTLSRIIYKNSVSLGNQFLRYGGNGMAPNWQEVIMNDSDLYKGYSYAAIRNRSNAVARIATEHIKTESDSKEKEFKHPYLGIISKSSTFSDYKFWSDISTYLDLEGVYYLLAIRNFSKTKVGKIQEFKLLNPYNIRRIINPETLEVSGYVETRKGLVREIPAQMIIEVRELNPFDPDKEFSMTDAAKESQFTLRTANDYTRSTLKNDINAPGIISTDVILKPEEFKNFTNRIKNHTKGEPIFGNGAGAITYTAMMSDLSKAALDKVNDMSRDELFAVSGVSKTIMGIEQSGTTRETAKVQKDLLAEGQVIPRIKLITDALNQDYKNGYPNEDKGVNARMIIDNPLGVDHEAEQKDIEVKDTKLDLYQKLLDEGYPKDKAAQYVKGEIDIDGLGEPKKPEVILPIETTPPDDSIPVNKMPSIKVINQGVVSQQEGALKNAVVNIQEQLVMNAINRVDKKGKNQFETEGEVITKTEKKDAFNDLLMVLTGFYGITMLLKGQEVMRDRLGEFALSGDFTLNKSIKKYIKKIAQKVSDSHIETIANDIFKTAQEAALKGLSQEQIIAEIKHKYSSQLVESRAKVIARTETNRAFTRAQFEADQQFIDQNGLTHRAFKQWHTRSDNPCPFCQSLEDEGPQPFDDAFRNIGDDIIVGKGDDKKVLRVDFETLEAGNAHPNCSCDYELIIQDE